MNTTTKEIIDKLKNLALQNDAKLDIHDNLSESKRSSLWYGGAIATVHFSNGYIMQVDAIGDVYATLYDDSGYIKDEVRDKNNSGEFGRTMCYYINTDAELFNLANSNKLIFDNNNWYEISIVDPDGKFHDLEWVDDSDDWEQAIRTAIECLSDVLDYINN